MNRKDLLADKSAEIQKQLEHWARNKEILKPGEQIVFSVQIAKVALVTEAPQETSEEWLNRPVIEFFTLARITDAGHPRPLAVRISNGVRTSVSSGAMSLRGFLDYHRTSRGYIHITNLGKQSVDIMLEMLKTAGIRF